MTRDFSQMDYVQAREHVAVCSIHLANTPERRAILEACGKDWALLLWQPTEEEREAERQVFRGFGRRAAERFDKAVFYALGITYSKST